MSKRHVTDTENTGNTCSDESKPSRVLMGALIFTITSHGYTIFGNALEARLVAKLDGRRWIEQDI